MISTLTPADQSRSRPWRRALFQLHLWTGLGFGLYLALLSVSGSAIVLRRELDKALCPQTVMVRAQAPRLSDAQIEAAARAVVRRFHGTVQVRGPRVPGAAVEVWYLTDRGRFERLIDPYTGKDLGDTVACEPAFVSGIADLHDNLWAGETGLTVNGLGALLLLLMCVTGAVLWWTGTLRRRRRMTLRVPVSWQRFIWDLHNVLGFWMFALLLLWAVSAAYLAFPDLVYSGGDLLAAHGVAPFSARSMDLFIDWMVRLHFGRTFGLGIKVLWVVLGLAPCGLMITGALMWWNRVVRRAPRGDAVALTERRAPVASADDGS